MKQQSVACLMVNVVAIAALMWAIVGEPPYGFFGYLQLLVPVACVWSARKAYEVSPWLTPLSAGLAGVAFVEFTGKMRREQWLPWNWAGVGLLAVASIAIVAADSRRNDGP
jgi:hypothetical protein